MESVYIGYLELLRLISISYARPGMYMGGCDPQVMHRQKIPDEELLRTSTRKIEATGG